MRLQALEERALMADVSADTVHVAMQHDDPKAALIDLIVDGPPRAPIDGDGSDSGSDFAGDSFSRAPGLSRTGRIYRPRRQRGSRSRSRSLSRSPR